MMNHRMEVGLRKRMLWCNRRWIDDCPTTRFPLAQNNYFRGICPSQNQRELSREFCPGMGNCLTLEWHRNRRCFS